VADTWNHHHLRSAVKLNWLILSVSEDKDANQLGEYLTLRLVLETWDRLGGLEAAIREGIAARAARGVRPEEKLFLAIK
jgi:hypothetical protein